jgi:hypothetical protein
MLNLNHTICLFLLIVGVNFFATAQGDLFEEEEYLSIYEESDLYLDNNKRPEFKSDPIASGGGGSIGSLSNLPELVKGNNPNNNPARGTDCVPTLPGVDPDVPINNEIEYLMIVGLLFGAYKLFIIKKNKTINNAF